MRYIADMETKAKTMTSIIDNETLLTLVEAWEAQTERLRNRRLGSGKKVIIQERERVARIARNALPAETQVA